ncbi:MAG: DNA polymerase ligase N-terminal domain-containing protein [Thermodesulfobacteriota bacterium]
MPKNKKSLKNYRQKRNAHRTSEPMPEDSSLTGTGKRPIFVIQQHDASTLHFDFRIQDQGVLKSWAVPKGPSTDPKQKRLAIPTEDHPLAYADFEGIIPEGEYGAGTVLVWDRGEYENLNKDKGEEKSVSKQIKDGQVTIRLKGKKISGGYALIRTGDKRWLLIKMDDEQADARRNPVSTDPESVKSGLTLDEIREKSKE